MCENEGWIDIIGPDDTSSLDFDLLLGVWQQVIVKITRRGRNFLETGHNPTSRHIPSIPVRKKSAGRTAGNGTIGERVVQKTAMCRQPKDLEAAQNRIAKAIAGRRGQETFRKLLLQTYQHCLITGCDAEDVLEAAHTRS